VKRITYGIIAGFIFAILDAVPMFFMDMPDKKLAITGAVINRFAIGLIIFVSDLKIPGWLRGLIIGGLLSLPDALITHTYGPILGFGLAGGLIIGYIAQKTTDKL